MTALSAVDVLIIGPREFAAMIEIPGFRDAMPMAIATSRSLIPLARKESMTDGGSLIMVVERLHGVPWFADAKLIGANYSPGAHDVWMGRPHRAS